MPADHPAPLLKPAYCIPHACDEAEHQRRWQAHVDAGRIGVSAPPATAPDPAIAANNARTAAIVRRGG